MKTGIRTLLAIAAMLSITSCEHRVPYKYSVINNADTMITVAIKTRISDTTYQVAVGESKQVFFDYRIQSKGEYYYRDVNVDIAAMTVIKGADTAGCDYTKNDCWLFNNMTGVYNATVTKSDF